MISNRISNTFLGRLFHQDRKLFICFSAFCLLSFLTNLFKLEATPFFLWGMYSEREQPVASYSVLQIQVNDSTEVDYSAGVTDNTRFLLLSPLQYYKEMRENNNVDPGLSLFMKKFPHISSAWSGTPARVFNTSAEMQLFPAWYHRYLSSVTGRKIHHLKVSELVVNYDASGNLNAVAVHEFLQRP